jgi:hypothetical protein
MSGTESAREREKVQAIVCGRRNLCEEFVHAPTVVAAR